MPRILLVDDHQAVQAGLRALLSSGFPDVQIELANSEQSLFAALANGHWELVVLDLQLAGRGGLELIPELKQMRPQVKVLVYTMHSESEFGLRAFRSGADGFLPKDRPVEDLFTAVRQMLQGRKYLSSDLAERLASAAAGNFEAEPHESLSSREYEVFCLLAEGATHSEVAAKLHINTKTVSTYQARIYDKLQVKTRSDLTRYAIKHGLKWQ
ncbi:MAG: response regulator [Terriglobia bacterium]